ALPLLGERFFYSEPATLRSLAAHYVQQHLKGMTPQQLARYLPPAALELNQVVVRVNLNLTTAPLDDQDRALQAVAEPLGDARVRRLYARPWERELEVADLQMRLSNGKANVVLVGETGCGKTTVLVEAVKLLEKDLAQQKRQTDDESDSPGPKSKHRFW